MTRASGPPASPAVRLATRFRVVARRTYRRVGGHTLELDLQIPKEAGGPWPVVVFFHGGGWITGSRESVSLHLLPWMERGWATANVSYRLARDALAPAAAWDARHAVAWVAEHAAEHGLDARRIVLGGFSSGAHLALMAALPGHLPPAHGEDPSRTPHTTVAAVVSWFGISDVAALMAGPRPRAFARHWLGPRADAMELAYALSPVERVPAAQRPPPASTGSGYGGPPPVVSVHGDRDPVIPFQQSSRLHEALDRAGAPNLLHVVEGGRHGDWDEATWGRAYDAVFGFVEGHPRGAVILPVHDPAEG